MEMVNIGKLFDEFEALFRTATAEIHSLDFDNVRLSEEWLKRVQMEDKLAKNCLDDVHHKLQGDEADKASMQQAITQRQREIDTKKSEKIQKRELLDFAKKCLEEKKCEVDVATVSLQEIQQGYDQIAAELDNAENRLQITTAWYKDELNMEFNVEGSGIIIIFTNISPSDPSLAHRLVLKKQRAGYKVTVCEPKINISKRQLDDLDQGSWVSSSSWKQFLVQIRKSFLALYEK